MEKGEREKEREREMLMRDRNNFPFLNITDVSSTRCVHPRCVY